MKRILRNTLLTIAILLIAAIIAAMSIDFRSILPPRTSGPCFRDRTLEKQTQKQQKVFNGIDVSHHQGTIDWGKIKSDHPELAFVYVKCSEGRDYVDPKFKFNATRASALGFRVGAYHYFRMTSGAQEQFHHFKKQMDAVQIDLIPMVDVETSDGKSRENVQDSLRVLLTLLEKEYGRKPMIYGTNRSYNELCAPEFNGYPLYIARYGKNKPIVKGPSHYSIWQYTDKGVITGIPKKVDLCRFHKDCSIRDIQL